MEVIIIEDEKPAARRLQRMLSRLGVETGVMLNSVAEAVNWFNENPHPDLIFLDIQLSDGISFEIFEHVKVKSSIIFTTAYDEYALRAFKVNSVDYLLKPIDEEELEDALNKYKETNSLKGFGKIKVEDLKSLLNISTIKTYKSRFTAQVGQHLKLIETTETACFFSENKATYIHTFSGRNYPINTSLELLEPEIDPTKFYRINRKCIVNIEALEDIISYSNSRLKLKLKNFNAFELIVSRERVKDFKEWLSNG